jgi:H+/Cl- antiporter ClcA
MTDIAKLLIVLGVVLLVAGVVLTMLAKANLPLGRLPGDIVYRGKHTAFYFPLVTSLLVSVVLSIVLYVLARWRH